MDGFVFWYTALTLAAMAVLALCALADWLTGREERAGAFVAALIGVAFLPVVVLVIVLRLLIPRGHDE